MKRIKFIGKLMVVSLFLLGISYASSSPLWTIVPTTSTSVSSTGTATIQYTVTNQSSRTHALTMNSVPGVSVVTGGAGACNNITNTTTGQSLSGHASCTLTLQVIGSQFPVGTTAPVICQVNSNQCYRPAAINVIGGSGGGATYTVGGTVYINSIAHPLTNTITLLLNGTGQTFTLSGGAGSSTPYTFSTTLNNGDQYTIDFGTEPQGTSCNFDSTSSNAPLTGTIDGANVTNINITCI